MSRAHAGSNGASAHEELACAPGRRCLPPQYSSMKKLLVPLAIGILTLAVCLLVLELYLERLGYGNPPLYAHDPAIGFVLKPGQFLSRAHGCEVVINNLGMRGRDTTKEKPVGVKRVVVFGDSVPYGGSYIHQDDVFCAVAQSTLNRHSKGTKYEILNAGVNALGPRNVREYVKRRGLYGADMVIVFFPWGNLRRDYTTYYAVPFWSNSPRYALAEFCRHACWAAFGYLSQRWKEVDAFTNQDNLLMNIEALADIKDICAAARTPVYFFWSPYRAALKGQPDSYESDREILRKAIPSAMMVMLDPLFAKVGDPDPLFVDEAHYSAKGHRLVGEYLAEFVAGRLN